MKSIVLDRSDSNKSPKLPPEKLPKSLFAQNIDKHLFRKFKRVTRKIVNLSNTTYQQRKILSQLSLPKPGDAVPMVPKKPKDSVWNETEDQTNSKQHDVTEYPLEEFPWQIKNTSLRVSPPKYHMTSTFTETHYNTNSLAVQPKHIKQSSSLNVSSSRFFDPRETRNSILKLERLKHAKSVEKLHSPKSFQPSSDSTRLMIPPNSVYRKVLAPLSCLELVDFNAGMKKALSHNSKMKSAITGFYSEAKDNLMNQTKNEWDKWESKMSIGKRQKKFIKPPQEEVMYLAASVAKSLEKPERNYRKNQFGFQGYQSAYPDFRERETMVDSSGIRAKEIFYKAAWSKPNPAFLPLPSNESSRMVCVRDTPTVISKDARGYLAWTMNPRSYEFKCGLLNMPPEEEARRDYTCAAYEDKVLIFSGQSIDIRYHPDYLKNDVILTNTEKPPEVIHPHSSSKGSVVPEPGRKKAAVIVFGRFFFVHGGTNKADQVTGTFNYLDLKSKRWGRVSSNKKIPPIELHSMAAAYKNPLYAKCSEFDVEQPKIKSTYNEGMFVFGGKDENGNCLNHLWKYQFFVRPVLLHYMPSAGNAPAARYSCCLEYLPNLHCLVVFGGTNGSVCFNDLHIYNLPLSTWAEIKITSRYMPEPRAGFSAFPTSTANSSKLYIHGGLFEGHFVKGRLEIVEFDENTYTKIIISEDGKEEPIEKEEVLLTGQQTYLKRRKFVQNLLKSVPRANNYMPLPTEAVASKLS